MHIKIALDSAQNELQFFQIQIFLLLKNRSESVQIWRIFNQFQAPVIEYLEHHLVVLLVDIIDKGVLELSYLLWTHSTASNLSVLEVLEILNGLQGRDVVELVFQGLCKIVVVGKVIKLSFIGNAAHLLVLIQALEKTVLETLVIVFLYIFVNKILNLETTFSTVAGLCFRREIHVLCTDNALLSSGLVVRGLEKI